MKYRLVDILACPICKKFPLLLIVFKINKYMRPSNISKEPLCELYCSYKKSYIKNISKYFCNKCIELEIDAGILFCDNCNRWYPIEEEIPRLLPDELRDEKESIDFLMQYKNLIPKFILHNGKPFNLKM